MLPPNAGRICTRSVFGFISRVVQSAVRPVLKRVAARGARERPIDVPPTRTTLGFISVYQVFKYIGVCVNALNSAS